LQECIFLCCVRVIRRPAGHTPPSVYPFFYFGEVSNFTWVRRRHGLSS
jgi:hypothetical protein